MVLTFTISLLLCPLTQQISNSLLTQGIISPENNAFLSYGPKTKSFENYNLVSSFEKLYGTLFKSLYCLNQSLVLEIFSSITLNGYSGAHIN